MLCELSIKNIAIIDDLQISFSDGLAILSGETGAGKSIIINAVNLLLGSRATASLIRTGAETAEIQALFSISEKSATAAMLKEMDLYASDELLIRRIVSRSDRHKIYINGRLSTMQMLSSVMDNLASISGQHAHQGLLKEDQHLLVLDQFGGLTALRNSVSACFSKILPLIREMNDLKALQNRQSDQIDLLTFQKQEIEDAAIAPDEDTVLDLERLRLKNAEMLFTTVNGAIETLYDAEGAVTERLKNLTATLEKAGKIDPELTIPAKEIEDTAYRVEDITDRLRSYLQNIQVDDRRIEEIEERIDMLNKLKRKYGGSLESIRRRFDAISEELSTIENLGDKINETEKELIAVHKELVALAKDLSQKRIKAADKMAHKVETELGTLKMPRTRFKVLLEPAGPGKNTEPYLSADGNAITESGIDRAIFMIAPNVGEDMKPLSSIASGGELSRMILALKAIQAETDSVETVIFDEVDAGIGGGVAEVIGKKLSELSKRHQIICITHLAQIAKFGDHHFNISKQVEKGKTRTIIRELDDKERINEIARMIGGEKITKTTLDHAREMLGSV